MKNLSLRLSIALFTVVLTTFAYSQSPAASCCHKGASCCEKGASCCQKALSR